MTLELQILALAGLLWTLQLLGLSIAGNLQLSTRWVLGPRDEPQPLRGLAGRLQRAQSNMTESLLLFAVAVVVLEFGGKSGGPLTEGGAVAYLVARPGLCARLCLRAHALALGNLVRRLRRDPRDAALRAARLIAFDSPRSPGPVTVSRHAILPHIDCPIALQWLESAALALRTGRRNDFTQRNPAPSRRWAVIKLSRLTHRAVIQQD